MPGSHFQAFDAAAVALFFASEFIVSNHSDRTGLRLTGTPVASPHSGRLVSEGMPCGAVQAPPNGEPIVLMPDHPTTGGYPVIACVATVDLCALGQLRPGDRIRFSMVTPAAARSLFHERERQLDALVPRA